MVVRPYFTPDRQVLPFDKVIELERIDDWTFRSIVKAYSPTGGENGTYGGHVFAQAAWAAAQTVPEGYVIHNITGFFILGGRPNEHYTYRVIKLRDGYNYITRSVTVSQIASHGDMFTCTCSFKREEPSPIDVQESVDLQELYHQVLKGKENDPMQHEPAPSIDSAYFRDTYLPAHPTHYNPIAGLHLRKVNMHPFNTSRPPLHRRQLLFYSLRGALPPPSPSPSSPPPAKAANLHACAHLYASDRNSLFLVPNHLDRPRDFSRMASLSHTVIFHTGLQGLVMAPEPRNQLGSVNTDPTLWDTEAAPEPECGSVAHGDGDGDGDGGGDGSRWYLQEAWVARVAGGRALHTSRLWDYARGVHIATTFQDGLVRFRAAAGEGKL